MSLNKKLVLEIQMKIQLILSVLINLAESSERIWLTMEPNTQELEPQFSNRL